jgi:hypothetical protein
MNYRNIILNILLALLISSCQQNQFHEVKEIEGNIFGILNDGASKQITYLGKDINPLLSLDNKTVYFIRKTGNFGEFEYEGQEQLAIMKVDLHELNEEKLTDTIRYSDWNLTLELFEVTDFSLSNDGQFLFFITQKWTTSGVLVKLNTQTKELTELSHGDRFEFLKNGQYKNHLIVKRSSIKNNVGREWSNWLLNTSGEEIKEIGDDDAVIKFKENSY